MAVSDQRPVLVTGGTGLLGEAIAERFVDTGKQVIVTSRNISRVDDFCAEKNSEYDTERWIPLEIDLRDPDSIREAVELLEESKVYPSRIVANASARDALGPEFDELTHSEFTHLFEVDVTGHMLLARELRSIVPNQDIASVVFMSSIYAIQGVDDRIYPVDMLPTPIHYSTVKSAMEGLARSLATKWRTTTRVNVVIAGGVRSTDRQNEEFVDEYSEKTLVGRLSEPGEIADAVYFLSSDAASYITGHSLVVDGGYSVW